MMALIFLALAVLALWSFTKTDYADEKPLAVTERADPTWGVPITICLTLILLGLLAGLMGNSIEGSAYATVEAAGDADLMNMFIGSSLLGCIGGLMLVNGIARPIGLLLLLAGILGSVSVTELVR